MSKRFLKDFTTILRKLRSRSHLYLECLCRHGCEHNIIEYAGICVATTAIKHISRYPRWYVCFRSCRPCCWVFLSILFYNTYTETSSDSDDDKESSDASQDRGDNMGRDHNGEKDAKVGRGMKNLTQLREACLLFEKWY